MSDTIRELPDKDAASFLQSLSCRGAGDWRSPTGESFDDADIAELLAKRFRHAKDTLQRIDTAWRAIGLTCDCGVPGEACNICEITHLLDEHKQS